MSSPLGTLSCHPGQRDQGSSTTLDCAFAPSAPFTSQSAPFSYACPPTDLSVRPVFKTLLQIQHRTARPWQRKGQSQTPQVRDNYAREEVASFPKEKVHSPRESERSSRFPGRCKPKLVESLRCITRPRPVCSVQVRAS